MPDLTVSSFSSRAGYCKRNNAPYMGTVTGQWIVAKLNAVMPVLGQCVHWCFGLYLIRHCLLYLQMVLSFK